ncbi:MAG: hypothetical protein JJ992_29700, partial [Planctomycetes bacterium]|nr:hypothetical protein [Planctomycetota bacterium]
GHSQDLLTCLNSLVERRAQRGGQPPSGSLVRPESSSLDSSKKAEQTEDTVGGILLEQVAFGQVRIVTGQGQFQLFLAFEQGVPRAVCSVPVWAFRQVSEACFRPQRRLRHFRSR